MSLLRIFLWVHTVLLFSLVKAGFLHWILKQNELLLAQSFNVIQLYRCWERNLLIKKLISIFTLWIFHLYVAAFHQHRQMDYTSLSWNDVRLYEFGNPWSRLALTVSRMSTYMFGLYWLQVISLVLSHDLSPCVTYERLLAWTAWWMPRVEQDLIYHRELLYPTPVLTGLLLLEL